MVKIRRKPEWLQKKIQPAAHAEMERMLGSLRLNTVCREACCPNISECFRQRQATFLILGEVCTRRCSFCSVSKEQPLPVDPQEPQRVAQGVQRLGLEHVVITSPTRDDLSDGGAALYVRTVEEIRNLSPQTRIELLVPDFAGNVDALAAVLGANPDILGHNLETVPRLYAVREGAVYARSLELLREARRLSPQMKTKSGIMLGLGETAEEVLQVFRDLREAGCSFLSVGQYLAPSRKHHPVVDFIPPEAFESYREEALRLGFEHVESGPYVRSSYHAGDYVAGEAKG